MPKKTGKSAEINVDDVCGAIRNGETMTAIARGLGVSRSVFIDWIAADDDRSARVREARQDAASAYEEQAMEEISLAQTPFELMKAKEMAHHLRWRASKINPKEYGDKQQVTHDGAMNVTLYDGEQARRMAELAYAAKPK